MLRHMTWARLRRECLPWFVSRGPGDQEEYQLVQASFHTRELEQIPVNLSGNSPQPTGKRELSKETMTKRATFWTLLVEHPLLLGLLLERPEQVFPLPVLRR